MARCRRGRVDVPIGEELEQYGSVRRLAQSRAAARATAVYLFVPDRNSNRRVAYLANFKGVLHVYGYAGFEHLAEIGDVALAACWSHTRRKFYEVVEAAGSPVAAETFAGLAGVPDKLLPGRQCSGSTHRLRPHHSSRDDRGIPPVQR
jgi:hypothetical protein